MSIEVRYRLEYCVFFLDKNDDSIPSKKFETINKKVHDTVKQITEEVFNSKTRDNQYTSIYYQYVKNSHDKEYDFKNSNYECVELRDEKIMEHECEFIAGQMLSYIQQLRREMTKKFLVCNRM